MGWSRNAMCYDKEFGAPLESTVELDMQRDQIKKDMECLDKMSYFPGPAERYKKTSGEPTTRWSVRDTRQKARAALEVLSEYHGKFHRKQQAWKDKKREHENTKKVERTGEKADELNQVYDQGRPKHVELEEIVKMLQREKAKEEGQCEQNEAAVAQRNCCRICTTKANKDCSSAKQV